MYTYRHTATAFILLTGLVLAATPTSDSSAAEPGSPEYKKAVEEILEIGGSVRPVSQKNKDVVVEFHLRGTDLTDDGLKHVAALGNLVSLNLRGTKITGAGLAHLKGLTKLRQLHLEKTTIADEGIEHLAGLTGLEYLNLYGTQVGDKALEHLTKLDKLRSIYLWQTKVTDEGVAKLEKALPKLEVVRGVDLTKLPTTPSTPAGKPVNLKWNKAAGKEPPKSQVGTAISITFENKRDKRVKLYWISYSNKKTLYAVLEPGKKRQQNTFSKATWLITEEDDKPLGFFITGADLENIAVIPK